MSRSKAINSMCRQCIYDPIGGTGTWREQVAACASSGCPLYDFRPKPRYETEDERAARLAGVTLKEFRSDVSIQG